jgi:hypothetical protein
LAALSWDKRPRERGRDPTKILIAIEPRSYREVLVLAVGSVRPSHEVAMVEPEDVGRELGRLDPDLVFAPWPNTLAPEDHPAWVEFTPYETPQAKICVAGRTTELAEVDFEDLLSIVDEVAAEVAETHRASGGC